MCFKGISKEGTFNRKCKGLPHHKGKISFINLDQVMATSSCSDDLRALESEFVQRGSEMHSSANPSKAFECTWSPWSQINKLSKVELLYIEECPQKMPADLKIK